MSANRAVVADPEAPGRSVIRPVAEPVPDCAVSLLFNPSRCVEELRPFVKRLGHGSEEHPAWTSVFRVECQTHGAGRPR